MAISTCNVPKSFSLRKTYCKSTKTAFSPMKKIGNLSKDDLKYLPSYYVYIRIYEFCRTHVTLGNQPTLPHTPLIEHALRVSQSTMASNDVEECLEESEQTDELTDSFDEWRSKVVKETESRRIKKLNDITWRLCTY